MRHEDDRLGAWLLSSDNLFVEPNPPLSIAYLMVGRAATIRYPVSMNMNRYLEILAYSRVGDVLLLILTRGVSLYTLKGGGGSTWFNLRNVKVDSDEDLLPLEVDVGDRELG
jgi:hypothetical protein